MKYRITSVRHSYLGKIGDVVEIENITEVPYLVKLEMITDTDIEEKTPKKKKQNKGDK